MSDISPACTALSLGGDSVCAVVVAYYPDSEFERRLRILLPQVALLVVVDNTPQGGGVRRLDGLVAEADGKMRYIENRANLGVAAALNQGLACVSEAGCNWLLTLDQDTLPYPDMVSTLVAVSRACIPRPVVIGSNYFDPENGCFAVTPGGDGEWVTRKTVITSGSLVEAAAAQTAGGFREDYFIDQLDHEFCLRLRARGCHVVMTRKPAMRHSVGGPEGARVPIIGLVLPEHPPLRKYYIARNTVAIVAAYWRGEPAWCLRRIVRLLMGAASMALLERHGLAKLRAFALGVADGVRGRMGPCRRKWLLNR